VTGGGASPSPAAGIRLLRLYNFRNYPALDLDLDPGLNVFVGENAQGKSNLLEAVATLLLTRSPRAASPSELLRWGCDEAAVDATVVRPPLVETLGLRLRRHAPSHPAAPGDGERKDGEAPVPLRADTEARTRLSEAHGRVTRTSLANGKPITVRQMLGRCPVVLFWPDDLQLVKAGPEARRRQIDMLLSQLDVQAASDLLRYRRVVEQRNCLLRQMRAGESGDQLATFDAALVQHGARVQMARGRLVRALAPLAAESMAELSGGREQLQLRYRPDASTGAEDEEEIAASLRAALRRRREEELARAVTSVGPHRDDIEYLIDGRLARVSASQGQQRSAVLAAKLAELRHAGNQSGRMPVLLLDDVLSELDPRRGKQLLDALDGGETSPQTLITSTEHPHLGQRQARRFQVRMGTVVPG